MTNPPAAAVTINYGQFIQTVTDFLIIAVAIFVAVKIVNELQREKAKAPDSAPPPGREEQLLTEIRDLLGKGLASRDR